MSLVEQQPKESHDQVAATFVPRPVGTATLPDRSSFAPQAAFVEAVRYMEVVAHVAGGFVVDWELGGSTSEQR